MVVNKVILPEQLVGLVILEGIKCNAHVVKRSKDFFCACQVWLEGKVSRLNVARYPVTVAHSHNIDV